MTTSDIREFLQGFSTDELKARRILFGPRNLLMGLGLRPLMALMNETGVTRLESPAHGWFLDEKGQFRNSKSGELKEGNIADLQRPGNVFNLMNGAINPHFLIAEPGTTPEVELEAAEELNFGIEKDMQDALRRNIEQLESGLKIIDGGKERIVDETLRIDITAQDREGKVVVIELKAGTASQDSIAQTLAYMACVRSEEKKHVRGILVAADFHRKVLLAAQEVPNLQLKRYSFSFTFRNP